MNPFRKIKTYTRITLICVINLIQLFPSTYNNANAMQIVAIIGDSALTDYEVSQRAKIVAMLQGYNAKDKHLMERLEKELITVMIDEQIKKSYVEQLQVKIQSTEVEKFILAYGKKINAHSIEQIKTFIAKRKIDWDIFYDTVADEIAWSRIVYGGLAQHIQVSESEIMQRARMQNLDPSSSAVFENIKQQIMEERLALNVEKIISQVKKIRIIEQMNN